MDGDKDIMKEVIQRMRKRRRDTMRMIGDGAPRCSSVGMVNRAERSGLTRLDPSQPLSSLTKQAREYLLLEPEEDRSTTLRVENARFLETSMLMTTEVRVHDGWQNPTGSSSRNLTFSKDLSLAEPETDSPDLPCGSILAGSTRELHNFFVPEKFIDEDRRYVGGTRILVESEDGEKVHWEGAGRFVINLDCPEEIVSSIRLEKHTMIFREVAGVPGFESCSMWLVSDSESDHGAFVSDSWWPNKVKFALDYHMDCQYCSLAGRVCACSRIMLDRLRGNPLGPVQGWSQLLDCWNRLGPSRHSGSLNLERNIGATMQTPRSFSTRYMDNRSLILSFVRSRYLRKYDHVDVSFSGLEDRARTPPSIMTLEMCGETDGEASSEATANQSRTRQCPICFRSFARPGALKTHMSVSHEHRALFSCEHCGKSFPVRGNLTRHVNMVHLGIRRFFCSKCPASFYTARDFRIHDRNHNA